MIITFKSLIRLSFSSVFGICFAFLSKYLSALQVKGDLVAYREVYSIAISCLLENKSLYCYKWVSDDGDSSRWLENAALGFENFKKLFKERFL